ncbi:MAG: hypothetical protein CMG04_00275 [Candidatus Marinimicrobia bacterium]|nr:hypothetical protein [Candidatus Neomarinimicrobiota bacterium]
MILTFLFFFIIFINVFAVFRWGSLISFPLISLKINTPNIDPKNMVVIIGIIKSIILILVYA